MEIGFRSVYLQLSLKIENDNMIGGVETFRDLSLVEELRKELTGRHYLF